MFTNPKRWTQGESGIRAESVNNSIPGNLDAVRSLCSSHMAVSAQYEGASLVFPTGGVYVEGSHQYFTFSSTFQSGGKGAAAAWPGAEIVGSSSQAGIVWIPISSLLAAKKATESLFWNIEVGARPISSSVVYIPYGAVGSVGWVTYWGALDAIASNITYQYLGSDADSAPAAPLRNLSWNPAYTTRSVGSKGVTGVTWGTGNVPLNTQDMSTTNVDICAFKVMMKFFSDNRTTNYVNSIGATDFTLRVTVGIG